MVQRPDTPANRESPVPEALVRRQYRATCGTPSVEVPNRPPGAETELHVHDKDNNNLYSPKYMVDNKN